MLSWIFLSPEPLWMGKTANTIKTLAPVSFLFLFQGANHLPNQNSGCYCYWKHNFINKSPSQEKGEKADGLQICKVISISIPVHMGSSDLFNKSRTLKTALPCTRKGITFEAQMPWLFRTKWKSFCKCIPAKLKSSFQKVPLVKLKWKFLTFWSSECVPFETIGFYFRQWSISVVLRLGQRLIFMMEEHARLFEPCLAAKSPYSSCILLRRSSEWFFHQSTDSNSVYAKDLHLTLPPVTQGFRPERQSYNSLRDKRMPTWMFKNCKKMVIYHGISACPAPNSGAVPMKGGVLSWTMKQKKIKLCKEISLIAPH